jgi:hypothetical protein
MLLLFLGPENVQPYYFVPIIYIFKQVANISRSKCIILYHFYFLTSRKVISIYTRGSQPVFVPRPLLLKWRFPTPVLPSSSIHCMWILGGVSTIFEIILFGGTLDENIQAYFPPTKSHVPWTFLLDHSLWEPLIFKIMVIISARPLHASHDSVRCVLAGRTTRLVHI